MKQKNKTTCNLVLTGILLLSFIASKTQAQEVILTSGSNASGSGGEASYSIGQIFQETLSNSSGSVIQGIQFNFTSLALTIIDLDNNLEISTYPNPTSSIININIDAFKTNTISYKLFDTFGKLVTNGKVVNKITTVNIDKLQTAIYILKIENSTNNTTKTFKIIKN